MYICTLHFRLFKVLIWQLLQLHFSQFLVLLPCVLIMSHACIDQGPKGNKRSKVTYLVEKVDVLGKLDTRMRMLQLSAIAVKTIRSFLLLWAGIAQSL